MEKFCTIIVSATLAEQAKEAAISIDADHGTGLFTVGLSADGSLPATHYISSGYVCEELFDQLPTVVEVDCTEEDPHTAMLRMGLQMVTNDPGT